MLFKLTSRSTAIIVPFLGSWSDGISFRSIRNLLARSSDFDVLLTLSGFGISHYIVREPRFFRRSERLAVLPMHLPAARHFDGLGHPPHGLNDDDLLFPYTVFFSVSCFEKSVLAILIFSHESSKWSSIVRASSSKSSVQSIMFSA